MDDNICEKCGTRNEPGAQFCVKCQAFLPWNDMGESNLQALGIDAAAGTEPAGSRGDVAPTPPVADPAPVVPATPSAEAVIVRAPATPMVLRAAPSIIRAKDAEPGSFRVTIDNSDGNQGRRVRLSGRDPEGVVRFFFARSAIEVRPGESASADVRIEAPAPEPGQQAIRQLTVTAADGESLVESTVTFLQVGSVEVPMTLWVEPSLVRVRDAAAGSLEIGIDNRRGTRTRRVFLSGRDPERLVRFTFFPPSLDVFAGELGRARLKIEAQQPPPGEEASRPLRIVATCAGSADLEGTATFVQTRSAAPVDTPVTLRLDPSVVLVRDTAVGQLEAIVDNLGGSRMWRVFLTGRDPERLVKFTFSPPSLDVLSGDIGRVRVRMEARPPEPGQEAIRQVTVVAGDGRRGIESSGAFVQITSPKPVNRAEVFGTFEPTLAQDLKPNYTVPTTVTNRVAQLSAESPPSRTLPEETAGARFAFICYSRRDAELVRRLEQDLNQRGIQTWRDSHISIGNNWRNEVQQAIERCSNFIVVMSEDMPSEEMAMEIEWAKRKKKPLFPLSVNNSVYFELVGKQYVELTTEPLDEEVVRRLGDSS